MTTELQQKLLDKYPEFFSTHLRIYIGKEPLEKEIHELLDQKEMVIPIQFGFECGDGWFMLLDELMSEIQNHIENENRNRKNKLLPLFWKLQYWFRRYKTTRPIGDWIYDHAPRKKFKPLIVSVTQIKEKMGGLRFYYTGGDDYIFGLTMFAESLSYRICEKCGTTLNVGQTNGWIYTCCWDCLNKNERAKNLSWKLND